MPPAQTASVGSLTSQSFPLGAVGLSYEGFSLGDLAATAPGSFLDKYLQAVRPGVLRIGGSTSDESFFTSTGEKAPGWARFTVTPAMFQGLRNLLDRTAWKAVISLNLAYLDPSRAASELSSAQAALGRDLVGYEIANEPDAYGFGYRPSTYSFANFTSDLDSYLSAIRATGMTPPPLWGPDFSVQRWLPDFNVQLAAGSQRWAAITQHFYPMNACRPNNPTESDLMSVDVRAFETYFINHWQSATNGAALPHILDETNSIACGGNPTSRLPSSGIWAYDYVLRAMQLGVSGIDFHGNSFDCVHAFYAPVCVSPDRVMPVGNGLIAASALEGGVFRAVTQATDPNLVAYDVELGTSDTISLLNFNATPVGPVQVNLPAPVSAVSVGVLDPANTSLDMPAVTWNQAPYAVTRTSSTTLTVASVPAQALLLIKWSPTQRPTH